MYSKIYINNKTLYLCDELDEQLNKMVHKPENVFIDELNNHTIKTMIRELSLPEIKSGIFYNADLNALKTAFFKKFEIIKAGGGLIENENGDVLMILRRGFWDLPKGKLDAGETIEECAVREVNEETGLTNIKLVKPLTITYHTYEQGSHHILKESHWFLMKGNSSEALIPQTEEDILEIKWVPKNELGQYIPKAYPSIADVLQLVK